MSETEPLGASRFSEYWNTQMANPEFAKLFQIESLKKNLWLSIVEAWHSAGISQDEIAEVLGMTAEEIENLEKNTFEEVTIWELFTYVVALGPGFHLSIEINTPDIQ